MDIKSILRTTTLSTVALGLVSIPQTAAAVDLSFYDTLGPSDNCSLSCTTTELWKVQGIIGSSTTKELSIGTPDTGLRPRDSANWEWSDSTIFDWSLHWNSIDEIATFAISQEHGQSETLIYDLAGLSPVNGMQLSTFVNKQAPEKLAAGTCLNLTLDSIDGKSLIVPATMTSNNIEGKSSQKIYIAGDSLIDGFTLAGTVSFDWPTFNPQEQSANSRAFFQLEANNADLKTLDNLGLKQATVITSNAYADVPEPTSILGLLTLVGGGLLAKLASTEGNKE